MIYEFLCVILLILYFLVVLHIIYVNENQTKFLVLQQNEHKHHNNDLPVNIFTIFDFVVKQWLELSSQLERNSINHVQQVAHCLCHKPLPCLTHKRKISKKQQVILANNACTFRGGDEQEDNVLLVFKFLNKPNFVKTLKKMMQCFARYSGKTVSSPSLLNNASQHGKKLKHKQIYVALLQEQVKNALVSGSPLLIFLGNLSQFDPHRRALLPAKKTTSSLVYCSTVNKELFEKVKLPLAALKHTKLAPKKELKNSIGYSLSKNNKKKTVNENKSNMSRNQYIVSHKSFIGTGSTTRSPNPTINRIKVANNRFVYLNNCVSNSQVLAHQCSEQYTFVELKQVATLLQSLERATTLHVNTSNDMQIRSEAALLLQNVNRKQLEIESMANVKSIFKEIQSCLRTGMLVNQFELYKRTCEDMIHMHKMQTCKYSFIENSNAVEIAQTIFRQAQVVENNLKLQQLHALYFKTTEEVEFENLRNATLVLQSRFMQDKEVKYYVTKNAIRKLRTKIHKMYKAQQQQQQQPEDDVAKDVASVMSLLKKRETIDSCLNNSVFSVINECIHSQSPILDLREKNLTELPDLMRECKHVKVLMLNNNKIRELPEWFATTFAEAKEVYLAGNLLQTLANNWNKMQSLEKLDLSFNKLEFFPEAINQVSKTLQELSLNNNILMSVPSAIESLTKLTYLDLSNNQLMTLPDVLHKLPLLQEVKFDDNAFLRSEQARVIEISEAVRKSSLQVEQQDNLVKQQQQQFGELGENIVDDESDDSITEDFSPAVNTPSVCNESNFLIDIADFPEFVTQEKSPRYVLPVEEEEEEENNLAANRFSSKDQHANARISLEISEAVIKERCNLLLELLDSERRYVKYLQTLHDVYYVPLIEKKSKGLKINGKKIKHEILPLAIRKKIFPPNLKVLIQFHSDLLEALEGRLQVARGLPQQVLYFHGVGDIFVRLSADLHVYNDYIIGFSHSNLLLKKAKILHKQFADWLEELEHSPESLGHDIASLMIMPVQRVFRYVLLLNAVAKKTDPEHADAEALGQAIQLLEERAVALNKKVEEHDALAKIHELAITLKLKDLVQPSRRLIREGAISMFKKTKTPNNMKKIVYKAYLFNDLLLLYRIKGKIVKRTSLKQFPLLHADIVNQANDNKINLKVGKRIYSLVFDARNHFEDWFKDMAKLLADKASMLSVPPLVSKNTFKDSFFEKIQQVRKRASSLPFGFTASSVTAATTITLPPTKEDTPSAMRVGGMASKSLPCTPRTAVALEKNYENDEKSL